MIVPVHISLSQKYLEILPICERVFAKTSCRFHFQFEQLQPSIFSSDVNVCFAIKSVLVRSSEERGSIDSRDKTRSEKMLRNFATKSDACQCTVQCPSQKFQIFRSFCKFSCEKPIQINQVSRGWRQNDTETSLTP